MQFVREERKGGKVVTIQADLPLDQKFTGYEGANFYLKRGWKSLEAVQRAKAAQVAAKTREDAAALARAANKVKVEVITKEGAKALCH